MKLIMYLDNVAIGSIEVLTIDDRIDLKGSMDKLLELHGRAVKASSAKPAFLLEGVPTGLGSFSPLSHHMKKLHGHKETNGV